MNQVHSISCSRPFEGKTEGEQTNLSLALRIAAIVSGVVAIVVGSVMLGVPGLGHLTAYGWTLLTVGSLLVIGGISIKYIKTNPDAESKAERMLDAASLINNNPETATPNASTDKVEKQKDGLQEETTSTEEQLEVPVLPKPKTATSNASNDEVEKQKDGLQEETTSTEERLEVPVLPKPKTATSNASNDEVEKQKDESSRAEDLSNFEPNKSDAKIEALNEKVQESHAREIFELSQDIMLVGHETEVEAIAFDDQSIFSCSTDGARRVWSLETSVCEAVHKGLGIPRFGSPYHRVAIEKDWRAFAHSRAVFVDSTVDDSRSFYFDVEGGRPDQIAINGDLVAVSIGGTLGGEDRVEVWSCSTKSLLHKFDIGRQVKELAFQTDTLVCVHYAHGKEKIVESFSLETGESLRKFQAEKYAGVHKNWAVCIDKNKTSIYSIESGECVKSFPQALPYFQKIIFTDDLLIGLSGFSFDMPNRVSRTFVNIHSAIDGALLQHFTLGDNCFGTDMKIVDDHLVVAAHLLTDGTFTKPRSEAEAKTVKILKFAKN